MTRAYNYGGGIVWIDSESGDWVAAHGAAFPTFTDDRARPQNGAIFWRTDFQAWYVWDRLTASWTAVGGGASGIAVQEVDGSPAVAAATTLKIDQADGFVVTDEGGGTARLDLSTFTDAAAGKVPASGGGTTNFLRADGSWAAPTAAPAPDLDAQLMAVAGLVM